MPRTAVRRFEQRDLPPAAAMLARGHARCRTRQPLLPARFESPEAWAKPLQAALDDSNASGFIAERDGRAAGFLIGKRELVASDSFPAKFSPPRSGVVSLFGVDEPDESIDVLTALYAPLADEWTDAGLFVHVLTVTAGDPASEAAWVELGFGRRVSFAVRDTSPVEAAPAANTAGVEGIEVRRATREDADLVMRMTMLNAAYHRESPILWPYLREVEPALHAFEEGALGDSANAAFLAYRDGEAVGMHLFLSPGFGGESRTPDGAVYLFDAITTPEARGSGIGSALLDRTMAWAREQGYACCTLHYATANPSGRAFWLRHGFVPLDHTYQRQVDERIAWARAPKPLR